MPSILVLTTSDQSASPLAAHCGIDLHVFYDREANLIAPLRDIFSNVIEFDVLAYYVQHGPTSTTKKLRQ